ncbi:MAG TPA: polysaccharide biosynthesis/export family protein [Candidatus Aminicenantes bacterium]|nr:polysaccharide biosynthesis/export family protein [Candidatus Aminicenantes bacterium]HRY65731.1 polysaccharide biosynthesis/export family protein [Candidatus Aminicenantes bacterium]HRZ72645.1 polysaccharide biosynthesis/export family protein [Candidatus Aminicenantes bacterium]
MKMKIAAIVLAVALAAAPGRAQVPPAPGQVPAAAQEARDTLARAYRIGPGDLLEVKVFEVDQLSQTVRVSEDGSLTLPLLGRVAVEGLTQEGVVQKLTGLLSAKYVKNPQVTIFIKEYKNQQVAVIGAVVKAGSYELVGRKNLLQIISMAGGFAETAGNEVFILREGQDGRTKTISIDLKDLLVNGNQALNVPVEPNDVINVPVDREIKVFVMGRVTRPGAVASKLTAGITLLQAIADAGGLAEGAKRGAITITRKDAAGKEQKIKVNLGDILKGRKKDIKLQEGDVVFVPESFW